MAQEDGLAKAASELDNNTPAEYIKKGKIDDVANLLTQDTKKDGSS